MARMTRIAELDAFARLHPDLWLDVNARDENEARYTIATDRRSLTAWNGRGADSDQRRLAA